MYKDKEIDNYINSLINQNLGYIGRAAATLCLGFGEKVLSTLKMKDEDKQMEVYKYRVHVQCSWRVINPSKGEIIFASDDIFEPMNKEEYTDNFVWDTPDGNLFDEKCNIWFESVSNLYVTQVQINDIGDLVIKFSNGDLLQTFSNISNDECWRFFESCSSKIKKKHLVVFANKIRF